MYKIERAPWGRRIITVLAGLGMLGGGLAACGSGSAAGPPANGGNGTPSDPVTLQLGYLANLTHAPAMIGVNNGSFQQAIGKNVTLKTQVFAAGPDAITALFGGALDMAFVGPSPAISGFIQSHGQALRVISGVAVGGAELVVRPAAGINSVSDLRGKTIATPQLGNTQDIALRVFLANHGMKVDPQGGGPVKVINAANSTIMTLFQEGQIDGAWVPEPYATRLVDEDEGKVLVNEASLWPGGQFPTTVLIVATSFLDAHPAVVSNFLKGLVSVINWTNANTTAAESAANNALTILASKPLFENVLLTAWSHLQFTVDPVAAAWQTEATHVVQAGLATDDNIKGIFDLGPLNQILQQEGKPPVSAAGLG
jgi:aliphatic sulfonates family ABC transporter substrate-binding protein